MRIVYDLNSDKRYVSQVQEATRTTSKFGIEPTHGVFGSKEWWHQIESGNLATHTIKGVISRVYMAGHNDWPEFEIVEADGSTSKWTREVNSEEQAELYECGRNAEIDYVLQNHRPSSWDRGAETKCVIEIRVTI